MIVENPESRNRLNIFAPKKDLYNVHWKHGLGLPEGGPDCPPDSSVRRKSGSWPILRRGVIRKVGPQARSCTMPFQAKKNSTRKIIAGLLRTVPESLLL